MIERDVKELESKLRNSFQAFREDVSSIKDSISNINSKFELDKDILKNEITLLKNKKEDKDNTEIKKLSKEINDLANYFSELKEDIKELRKIKDKKPEKIESDVKNIVEFNEVKSELSELKELIENIKIPAQKDYSKDISILSERINNFEDLVEETKKTIKNIKIPQIPTQKDYSEDLQDLAREIGEIKGSFINRKTLDRESIKLNEKLSEKISELSSKQTEIENKIEESDKKSLAYSLKKEISKLREQIENNEQNNQLNLEEIKKENRKLRQSIEQRDKDIEEKNEQLRRQAEQQNSELKNQIAYLKGRITSLSKEESETQKKIIIEGKPFKFPKVDFPKPSKNFLIIFISIIVVGLIILGIMFFAPQPANMKYNYLDVVASNSSGLPMNVFYKQNKIFTISGWESKLTYNNKEDRIAGNNITGWFFEDPITITNNKTWSNKYVFASLSQDNNSITNTQFDYALFKKKPYFKMQLTANSENNSKLGTTQYGFVIKDYNVYLQNGTILTNDNKLEEINGTTVRNGSVYQVDQTNYEIFFNSNNSNAIIFYSKDNSNFINNFQWNVYWVYVNGSDGIYPPLYFIILEDSNLIFLDGKWQVTSKYYSGDIEKYIYSSVSEMNKNGSNN